MQTPDSVETILARLMPPALSEAGQLGIESLIDELAGAEPVLPAGPSGKVVWMRRLCISGIAAAAAIAAFVFPHHNARVPTVSSEGGKHTAEMVLVSESDRIESTTDEGWLEDEDGAAMRAMRLSVVEENNLLDEETGTVMTVTEPREELLLMPVSSF